MVAFAFGAPKMILPNQQIGIIASYNAQFFKTSVYAQKDVPLKNEITVVYAEEEDNNPPPTLRIARGAVEWAVKNGFGQLLVVAAKPHIKRCIRDLKYAIREAKAKIYVFASAEVEESFEKNWFCPDSTQKRTRSKKDWNKREWILTHMPMFLYKRIAG